MTLRVCVQSIAVASHEFMGYHGTDAPRAGAVLELGDPLAPPGGFGTVHPVEGVDGRGPARRLAAKIYDPAVVGTGDAIVEATQRLLAALEAKSPTDWPDRLLAVPFWLARTEINGTMHLVALMLDLTALGYEPCNFDGGADEQHRARPMTDRLRTAESFASAFEVFEQISYVHSDVNPENCLVNHATGDTQIIDLDAGAIIETGRERPLSVGKPDEFLPPELRFAAMHPNVVGSANPYTLEAERWSLGAMVGYLLFAAFPGFFLVNLSPRTLDDYSRSAASWPDIDASSPLFTRIPQNQQRYLALRAEFLAVPEPVGDLFRQFFRAAANGADRPTATDWKRGLSDLKQPPVLHTFDVSPPVAVRGATVELAWITTNTSHVAIDGLAGVFPPTGTTRVLATESMPFTLTLTNPYQQVQVSPGRVDVIEPPPLLVIPDPPMTSDTFATRVDRPVCGRIDRPGLPSFPRPTAPAAAAPTRPGWHSHPKPARADGPVRLLGGPTRPASPERPRIPLSRR